MTEPIKAMSPLRPEHLDNQEFRMMMGRAYAGFENDADQVCEFLKRELWSSENWLKLFVAYSEHRGFCGMSLILVSIDPLSPYPWIQHFYADRPEAREPLVEASIGYIRNRGFQKLYVLNQTGRSDEAHIRLFRKHGAGGEVKGGVILYDMGK